MRRAFPILEYDPEREALIDPRGVGASVQMPACCVLCFFQEAIDRLHQQGALRVITHLPSVMGRQGRHPVYAWQCQDQRVALVQPGVGAPFAAALFEEVIALGGRTFIACGGAGVLDPRIAAGHLIIPTVAVRDEGTSYHYLPPSREVAATPRAVAAIVQTLTAANVPFRLGKTWTTDGVYRETPGKIALRQAEGCLTVEMEAAALFAVAQFRQVLLGQMLYGSDDVSGLTWDQRRGAFDRTAVREQLLRLAAAACVALA
jgi:uridine phosphorylase